jgi:hypothetical protein
MRPPPEDGNFTAQQAVGVVVKSSFTGSFLGVTMSSTGVASM